MYTMLLNIKLINFKCLKIVCPKSQQKSYIVKMTRIFNTYVVHIILYIFRQLLLSNNDHLRTNEI